jgi:hypothetical protein
MPEALTSRAADPASSPTPTTSRSRAAERARLGRRRECRDLRLAGERGSLSDRSSATAIWRARANCTGGGSRWPT